MLELMYPGNSNINMINIHAHNHFMHAHLEHLACGHVTEWAELCWLICKSSADYDQSLQLDGNVT